MSATTASFAPLFGGLPGGAEILVLLLILGGFLVPVGLAIWVGVDAREYSDHPLAWALTVLVSGLSPFFVGSVAVTLLYYISRDELGSYAPPTFTEDDMDDGTMVLGQRLGDERGERAEPEAETAEGAESEAETERGEPETTTDGDGADEN